MAELSSFPVTIVADVNFTSDQQQNLSYVVAQWNSVGQQTLGQDVFILKYGPIPETVTGLNPTDCQQDFGGPQDLYLVREKSLDHWKKVGLSKMIPGATFRCEQGTQIAKQIIFIMPEVVDSSQFSSVVLHELGHSIGLDHSCLAQSSRRGDFKACPGLEMGHPYRQAVMYPWLHVASGRGDRPEVKDSLQSNDRLRASCALSSP